MDETERLIDAALDELPLAPTPPGFTRRVMAEIWKPALSFKLEFLDFVLPAFFALFGSTLLVGAMVAALNLDPLALLKLRYEAQFFLSRPDALPITPWAVWFLGAAAFGVVCFGVVAVFLASQSRRA